ncbi:hypothetical protein [Nocardia suismassiliense]|uniref:hypothetical protein n=1 Tax=Nocardia suismassiliense TaxID=2077092 RepID=UPI000D1F307E|nr:hypothetical protein [Nocardia suismassiliense]
MSDKQSAHEAANVVAQKGWPAEKVIWDWIDTAKQGLALPGPEPLRVTWPSLGRPSTSPVLRTVGVHAALTVERAVAQVLAAHEIPTTHIISVIDPVLSDLEHALDPKVARHRLQSGPDIRSVAVTTLGGIAIVTITDRSTVLADDIRIAAGRLPTFPGTPEQLHIAARTAEAAARELFSLYRALAQQVRGNPTPGP